MNERNIVVVLHFCIPGHPILCVLFESIITYRKKYVHIDLPIHGKYIRLQRNSSFAFRNHLFGIPTIFEKNFSMVKYLTIFCERLDMVKYITIVCMVKSVTIVSTLYCYTFTQTNYCYIFNHTHYTTFHKLLLQI